MRGAPIAALVPLLALCLGAACTIERADVRTPSGRPPEADTTQIRAVLETFRGAIVSGDLTPLDSLFSEDALVYASGRATRGWAEYRNGDLAESLEWLSERRLRFDDVAVHLADETAWATLRWTLMGVHDGAPATSRGVATFIFEKREGRWRLVHLHDSAVPASP